MIGRTNAGGGGGGGLNFWVVGGTTQPVNPKDNTIWVNTDIKITGYYFSAEQPKNMVHGDVWFSLDTSSNVKFNVLKKNEVWVYIHSAKQYVNGTLQEKSVKAYQNGQWATIATDYIIIPNVGVEWQLTENSTKNVDNSGAVFVIKAGSTTGSTGYALCEVDVSKYSVLQINGNIQDIGSGSGSERVRVGLFSYSAKELVLGVNSTSTNNVSFNETYDISSLSEKMWFGVSYTYARGSVDKTATFTVSTAKMER